MRNIKIIQKHCKNKGLLCSGSCDLAVFCLGDRGNLLICSGGVLSKFSLEDNHQDEQILLENREVLEDVFQMQYVVSTGALYLSNRRGSFLQYMIHDTEPEELFQSDQGISCFSASPDSRCVAILTSQSTLLLLTLPDLETLVQHDLMTGSITPEVIPNGLARVKIVWREDSHYFAICTKQEENYHIQIYDENGTFHSKTEESNPLLDSIVEWQPSGGLIAAVGNTPHGKVVSLFERNGLKRADFYPYEGKTEKYENCKIKNIFWNITSDILAIQFDMKVELWCRNNYVWMRKLTLYAEKEFETNGECENKNSLVFVAWDRERNNRLHFVSKSGDYTVYDVAFTYTTGYSNGASIAASWNGNTIYSTPFKNSCCPPPKCLFQSSCDADVKAVIVPEFWNGILSINTSGQFIFWRYEINGLIQLQVLSIPKFPQFAGSYDWLWPNRNTVCCVADGKLVVFEIQSDFEETDKEVLISMTVLDSITEIVSVFLATKNKECSSVLVQRESGLISKVNLKNESCLSICQFPHTCTQLQTLSDIIVSHDPVTRKLMAGWSKYPDCESVLVSNDCTSFMVFQNSIIYTTIQGTLEIRNEMCITKVLEKHMLGNQLTSEDESLGRYTRKCEKGSMILTCCLNQMLEPMLVLQIIPRGNLEIIYPRPLMVDAVKVIMREVENTSRYEKIMSALRRHRIDYRVLIDEMRVLVKENNDCTLEELLKTMVDQVKNLHSLVLLVTDLNQEYIDCIFVIKNILERVLAANKETRMLHVEESYLASMAKLGLLEEALKSFLILGENESNRDLVQHRVKFLSFYCENPDILFDTALGTYDLSLASIVADCLGKDPKEYIPVLDEFQSMLELKKRYKIDDKLRRYSKAVISLVRDQRVTHAEIIKYMDRHRLFTDAIEFLTRKLKYDDVGVVERSREDTELLLREAKLSYALYLEERGKFTEASILHKEADKFDNAVSCCMKSGNWEYALEILYENESSEEIIKDYCKKILAQLEEKKMFGDAARLCELYLCDLTQAVQFWIKDKNWQRASVLAVKSSLGKAFRNETIKSKLLESCNEQKEYVDYTIKDIENKMARLRQVKQIKAERIANSGGADDTFSDTDSYLSGSSTSGSLSSSNASGKTYRSGKNKRKLERKVYSLKEGSKHEDLAIVVHLWGTVDRFQEEVKPEISYTIESLWKFNEGECAVSLGEFLEKLIQISEKCVQEVWKEPITDDILEVKFRTPRITWTSLWNKLALHEPSSKATHPR